MSGGRQLLPPVIVVLSALARTGKQGEALALIFRTTRRRLCRGLPRAISYSDASPRRQARDQCRTFEYLGFSLLRVSSCRDPERQHPTQAAWRGRPYAVTCRLAPALIEIN